MPSKLVSLRVDDVLWQAVGDYAKQRGSTKTAVMDAALRGFLKDAEGGVPELETARPVARRPVVPNYMRERQERLRKEMGWDK
jgi:hypothetical protein